MSEALEDDATVDTHSLLLSLAGLVDDELLGWCRELVAVGEGDYALELVTATVQADRVRLPGPVHANLLSAATRARVLGRNELFPSPDTAPRMAHRFAVDPAEHGFPPRPEGQSPEAALRGVPTRLLRDCQLWLTWRLTPAGTAPGPLPHPVVLVETADVVGADVLAYQVAEVLSRAGVFASVEVFSSEFELSEYHRAALAQAHGVFGVEPDERPAPAAADTPASGAPPSPVPRAQPANGTVRGGAPRPEPGAPRPDNGGPRPGGPDTGVPRSVPENGGARPGPVQSDGSRRPPMHPVDRVITARSSAPRRPRPDRQPGSLDDVAAGLNFERGTAGYQPDTYPAEHEPAADVESGPIDGTDQADPSSAPPAPSTPPSSERRPPAPPRPDGSWTGGLPPVEPPRPPSPTVRPSPTPKRPAPRPGGVPEETDSELSDVEQRLLRQLHEELAAREDRSMLPDVDQPPSRIFRGANGSRKRPPRGPDRS